MGPHGTAQVGPYQGAPALEESPGETEPPPIHSAGESSPGPEKIFYDVAQ